MPSQRGAYRNVNASLRRFHEDLERIGLRARRQHDARLFATHGRAGDIMGEYTTLRWPALCAEAAKVRISLREGESSRPLASRQGRELARYSIRYSAGKQL